MFLVFIGYVGFVIGWYCALAAAAWSTVHEDRPEAH